MAWPGSRSQTTELGSPPKTPTESSAGSSGPLRSAITAASDWGSTSRDKLSRRTEAPSSSRANWAPARCSRCSSHFKPAFQLSVLPRGNTRQHLKQIQFECHAEDQTVILADEYLSFAKILSQRVDDGPAACE